MIKNDYYWYQVDVSLTFETDEGRTKKVKEVYLVKGISPTDVETQVNEDFEGVNYEFRILKITETKICKILKPEDVDLN